MELEDRLTMCNFYKLTLRVWVLVLVGMVFTTETLIGLFYVPFRCRPVHCSRNQSSSLQGSPALGENEQRTVKDFVQVGRTDKYSTDE